ncbi:MAG: ABC transporter ATP-binding protein [Actinomycetota bacterium]|nr:ABC transporter ATP-binding protein [Actinomycetota bacterium]
MPAVIQVQDLTKRYGTSRGVEDLTFEVGRGEAFGFLGPNGAGKTTTIRTILDFIRPTSGTVRVFGMDPRREGVRVHQRVGYLPGELALYERMTGEAFLRAFAELRGGDGSARVADLADRLGLDLSKRIHELSHGNKQKIGLVQAFMHHPDLLILDEPTQGLDPLVQQTFYAIVEEQRDHGAAIFLSSHVMPEVERVCDRVGIIREGRLATVADIGELKARVVRRLEFHFGMSVPVSAFEHLPGVKDVSMHGDSVILSVEGSVDAVIKEAARHDVVSVETHQPSLEEAFLAFYDSGEAR